MDITTTELLKRIQHAEDLCSGVSHYDYVMLLSSTDVDPNIIGFKIIKSKNSQPYQFRYDFARNKIV
jgi:hypothetical protein